MTDRLSKRFKTLFGTTFFTYLTELRVEQAHRLIRAGLAIGQISLQAGYKTPSISPPRLNVNSVICRVPSADAISGRT